VVRGDLSEFKRLAGTHDRRIQFAGDYWAISCVETSTASGERAGRALVRELNRARTGAVSVPSV
jgi:hypothetical protein